MKNNKPRCSCGRISVGWNRHGRYVCSFHGKKTNLLGGKNPTAIVKYHNYASIHSTSESLEVYQSKYLLDNLGEKP